MCFTTIKTKTSVDTYAESCYFSKLVSIFRKMDFSGNNRNCPHSLRILSEDTKILCPTRWEAKWPAGHLLCIWVAMKSLACWPLDWAGRTWDPAARPFQEQCFAWCLASEEAKFAGCCWPSAGPPASSFTPIPAPHLAWLHPGVTPALTASSTSEPGFDLTSQDPVSVEVHHCFRSTGYYPHSISSRWFISTLADLYILTFWLYRAPGPLS